MFRKKKNLNCNRLGLFTKWYGKLSTKPITAQMCGFGSGVGRTVQQEEASGKARERLPKGVNSDEVDHRKGVSSYSQEDL